MRKPLRFLGPRLGLGLVLMASSGQAGSQATGTERVLWIVAQADEVAREQVLELLAEIEGRAEDDARVARYLAELTLAVRLEPSDEARELVSETLGSFGAGKAEEAAFYTARLGEVHALGGHFDAAEGIVAFGLEHLDRENAWSQEPRLWHVRAEVARAAGRWTDAEEWLARMEGTIRADGAPELGSDRLRRQNRMYRARLGTARAQNLFELGLLDRCAEVIAAAEVEARESGDEHARVELRLLAIDRAMLADGHAQALKLAQEEEALVGPESPWRPLLLHAEGLARAELARQELVAGGTGATHAAEARRCLGAALAHPFFPPGERLKAELAMADLLLTLGELDVAEEHLRLARELASAAGTQEVLLAVHAWRLASARGAGHAELERAGAELRAAFGSFLEQWNRTPQREGGIGFLQLGWRRLVVSEVLGMELTLDGPEAAFGRLLEAETLGSAARARAASVPTLAELRAELVSERRGILVLLPARDRSHLFVLELERGDGQAELVVRHHALPSRDQLLQRARRIGSDLSDEDAEVEPKALAALSEQLLPPAVRARLEHWREAYVVGFDLLGGLPFGVLLDERGRAYGQRLALVNAPSLPHALESVRRARAPREPGLDLVLVAASTPPPESRQPVFPFGAREQALLEQPFARTYALLGADATRARVLAERARLTDARVVHFFAHGIDEPEREYRAALVLSAERGDPYLLRAEDVRQLELHGLVILSACGSSRSHSRVGDDQLVHLGGAFLDAGTRSVVLSRFPVRSVATLALMARLHAQLAAGASSAEALRAARAEGSGVEAFRACAFEVLGSGFEPVFPH